MEHTTIGNALVGQSGGPTSAINATLAGVIRGMIMHHNGDAGCGTLYGMKNGIEGLLREDIVNLSALFTKENGDVDDEQIRALAHTPAAALGSCRRKLPDAADPANAPFYENLLSIFRKYDIKTFFYIGGNDSMDTVAKLSAYTNANGYPLTVIGVPKTIDNDLEGTDHTPGFGSAAKFVASTLREIAADCAVYTIPAVTVVEIMGRDAGWLTASAGLCKMTDDMGPDLIYLPERAFSLENFFADVRAALSSHPNVVVAISEGIRFADGTLVSAMAKSGMDTDVFGHTALSGAGKVLELEIKRELGCKVRSVELNLPQRCCSHLLSRTDIGESLSVGRSAVDAAANGVTGVMMTIDRVANKPYCSEIHYLPVSGIANCVKGVPAEYINERGNGVTDACLAYLAPLIEGETYPAFQNGMPVFWQLPL